MAMDIESGSERELLDGHLNANRATAIRKVTGLTWEQATLRLGPTPTSAAGILKHLAEAERWWFRHHLEGEEGVPFWSTDADPDGEFELSTQDSVASLVAEYERACDESRAITARHALDDRCQRTGRSGHQPSLRWVYLHMIEEIARHNGHLDIYRELLDGTTDRA